LDATFAPEVPPTATTFKDRSGGLLACGIVEIALGGLALLFIPFILLGAVLSRKTTGTAMPAGSYVQSIAMYAFSAAVFVTLGIGSIRARRWARALNLVVSWIWLVLGVLSTILITAILPTGFKEGFKRAASMNPNAPPPPEMLMAVILTFVIVLFAVFLIVVPLILVLFFRRADVEETCKRRDPVERWTDRIPLPLLALGLLFACTAPYSLILGLSVPLVPFFGRYLTGLPGAIGCFVLACVDGILAFLVFRRQIIGWTLAVVWSAMRIISTAITFRHGDLSQAYSRMGWRGAQLDTMGPGGFARSLVLGWTVVIMLIFFGYLLWTRRYFVAAQAPVTLPPESSPPPPDFSPHQGSATL